jgi:hypothetical protein
LIPAAPIGTQLVVPSSFTIPHVSPLGQLPAPVPTRRVQGRTGSQTGTIVPAAAPPVIASTSQNESPVVIALALSHAAFPPQQ